MRTVGWAEPGTGVAGLFLPRFTKLGPQICRSRLNVLLIYGKLVGAGLGASSGCAIRL
jgi:hypothetical protein